MFWRKDDLKWATVRANVERPCGYSDGVARSRTSEWQISTDRVAFYILYKKNRAYYVGVVWGDRLGNRLRDHLEDQHEGMWDQFSWFGFRKSGGTTGPQWLANAGPVVRRSMSMHGLKPSAAIRDIGAVFIRALGLSSNVKQSGFTKATEWVQVTKKESDELRSDVKAKGRLPRKTR